MTSLPGRFPCSAEPELFHAPDGQHSHTDNYKRRVAAAKAICEGCPVMLACREEGRAAGARGIWGGEDDAEREAAGHKGASRPRRPAPCGTEAGAARHRRDGEPACQACLSAERIGHDNRAEKRSREQLATAA